MRPLLELSPNQNEILKAKGHLLITGGPGSGKTTVSILKAIDIVNEIFDSQQVLFLSFARQSVSRVMEVLEQHSNLTSNSKKHILVNTYHSFFWSIIKSHGYLLGLPRKLSVLDSPAKAVVLSEITHKYASLSQMGNLGIDNKDNEEYNKLCELAKNEGKICFDFFAIYTYKLLFGSKKLIELYSEKYPYIILDEFQDTSAKQWEVIKLFGQSSKLIALADPEQRIYDFIGADPERLSHFKVGFKPIEFNLTDENYRSQGSDILLFGNDILRGTYSKDDYSGVFCKTFEPNKNQAFFTLKSQTLRSVKRLKKNINKNWSLAILVPTKVMMYKVSNYFYSEQNKLPIVSHTVFIDTNSALLAAEIYAFFLQPKKEVDDQGLFIELMCRFFQGKGGDLPTKKDIQESQSIKRAYERFIQNKKLANNSKIKPLLEGYKLTRNIQLTGSPREDWQSISNALREAKCKRLTQIVEEVKNLKLLNRGGELKNILAQVWRDNGKYVNALDFFKQYFQKEHLSMSSKLENDVVIMNIHKSKGKQFDEVIIFEGWPHKNKGATVGNHDRIVKRNTNNQDLTQYKYMLRVGVTRAKSCCTIFTPKDDPCVLIPTKLLNIN